MGLHSVMPGHVSRKVVPAHAAGAEDGDAVEAPNSLKALVDNKSFTAVMTLVTFFALFGEDFRLSVFEKSADEVFYALAAVSLVLFTFEIAITCYAKPNEYTFNFYFWLDVIATISVIPDIGWITEGLDSSLGDEQSGKQIGQAGQATTQGARASKVVRIIRLVRLVRIVKLFKAAESGDDQVVKDEPSQVGKKLSELTTKRVIILVLALLWVLPLLDGGLDAAAELNEAREVGLQELHRYNMDLNVSNHVMEYQVQHFAASTGAIIHFELCQTPCPNSGLNKTHYTESDIVNFIKGTTFPNNPINNKVNPDNGWKAEAPLKSVTEINLEYRTTERLVLTTSSCWNKDHSVDLKARDPSCATTVYYDNKSYKRSEAALNILKTVFVMIILAGSSILFTRDAEKWVIRPIERMVSVVKDLAANPLAKTQEVGHDSSKKKGGDDAGYETNLLETTLKKIGVLLSIGFGEAGGEIIAKNMGDGDLDAMIPGKKLVAIFGFCDIRRFTDTTECLQEDVMVFVNRIGKIVHGCVHQFHGAANKNIGDAFLLVWKLTHADPLNADSWLGDPQITQTADNALASFLKIVVDTENSNDSGVLSTYATRDDVIARFGPGYRVKMGFGLHIGYAIEGAIGTSFKIDASYLSSHVNMSGKLEETTKEYGVMILLSGAFYKMLSSACAQRCRRLDCIDVAGVAHELYTFDICNNGLIIPEKLGEPASMDFLDYANDPMVAKLHEGIHKDFYPTHKLGIDAYLAGDWDAALAHLTQAESLWPNDGPTKSVLKFMKECGNTCPGDWNGVRTLD